MLSRSLVLPRDFRTFSYQVLGLPWECGVTFTDVGALEGVLFFFWGLLSVWYLLFFFLSLSFSLLLWRMRATCLSPAHTFRMFLLLPHCSPPFPLTGSVTRRAGVSTMRWTLELDVSPTSSLTALPLNPRGIHPTLSGLCVRTRISRLTST